jgi:hypothetical protein
MILWAMITLMTRRLARPGSGSETATKLVV